MSQFSELVLETPEPNEKFTRGGAGAPVIVLQSGEGAEHTAFHDILAKSFEVTVVSRRSGEQMTGSDLARLTRALDYDACSIVCDAGSAAAGLEYAFAEPNAVSRLVLQAPTTAVSSQYAALTTPVLVVESSKVPKSHVGQKIAEVIPQCYHILIYDAVEPLGVDRPEALAEVVGDFVDRGGGFIVSKPRGMIHP